MLFMIRSTDNKRQLGTIHGNTQLDAIRSAKKKFLESSPIIDLSLTEGGMKIIANLRAEIARMEK